MNHPPRVGINMSKLIEPLSGFLRKKEATTWTGIRIHHPTVFEMKSKKKNQGEKQRKKCPSFAERTNFSNFLDPFPRAAQFAALSTDP